MSQKNITITHLSAGQLAELLSNASRRKITAQQVLAIAEPAGIVTPDGTINLIEYTALLVSKVSNGSH